MDAELAYGPAGVGELAEIAGFARRVYDAAIAPDESEEGRATYARYADAVAMAARAERHAWWTARATGRDGGALVGVLEVRDGMHVSMLFVDPARQRAGIGRRLLAAAFGPPAAWPELTVNSTPGAVGAYERLGFRSMDVLQERNGLRFVPMRRATGAG